MLRLQTFGGLSVGHPARELGGATAQPRRLALLAVLACAGERGVARERLVALFWPDEDEERARRTLSQALYALRRDLGDERVITGTAALRLDPDAIGSDVAELRQHVRAGRLAEAAALYAGPFLQGFHLVGAPAFERWAEEERAGLAREHARVLERLATAAERAGAPAEAAAHWQALAATDPLDARITVRLMEALEAAGDRAGALRQARIYEALLAQELELPPDRTVVALAERLRAAPVVLAAPEPVAPEVASQAVAAEPVAAPELEAARGAPPETTIAPPPPIAGTDPTPVGAVSPHAPSPARPAPAASPSAPLPKARRRLRLAALAAIPLLAAAGALTALGWPTRGVRSADAPVPVLAVGLIDDFTSGASRDARPLADMLATNLARAEGVRVVSPGRMHELVRQLGSSATAPGGLVGAARQAGASSVVEGTLHRRADGALRLDLRHVELAGGAVRHALTVEAPDLFALADSATARLVALLGAGRPDGSIASVTTRSPVAYRVYDEGVRAYHAGDFQGAERLLLQAVAADSTFAMAAYYLALASRHANPLHLPPRMQRAAALAERAGERERLLIRVGSATTAQSPELRALAESLVTRYPDEIEGHVALANGLMLEGEYVRARQHLERALAMDSLGLRGDVSRCAGCAALQQLTASAVALDSMELARRDAERWTRLQPRSADAWLVLGTIHDREGRWAEAERAYGAMSALAPRTDLAPYAALVHALWQGRLDEAERMVRGRLQVGSPAEQTGAWWDLGIVLRHQGRMREALEAARRHADTRRAEHTATPDVGPAPASVRLAEAATLLDAGRAAEAAALFTAIARDEARPHEFPVVVERFRAWMLVHAATAHAMTGDDAALAAAQREIDAILRATPVPDPLYAHYVPGLRALVRGDTAAAIRHLRAATPLPGGAYTRAQLTLARVLAHTGRAPEAVRVLQAALRGDFFAARYYTNHTELHEELAAAWERVPGPAARDSAAAHWRRVADAWAGGDAPYAARAARARARVGATRATP